MDFILYTLRIRTLKKTGVEGPQTLVNSRVRSLLRRVLGSLGYIQTPGPSHVFHGRSRETLIPNARLRQEMMCNQCAVMELVP